MTPAQMAAIHHAAFDTARSWSEAEIADLLDTPFVTALTAPHGFALTRTLAGESELLTLAVDPAHRRHGIARSLMQDWLRSVHTTAQTTFLEVAADNTAARALYASLGFDIAATRKAYYTRPNSKPVDALVLRRDLTHGQRLDSAQQTTESG